MNFEISPVSKYNQTFGRKGLVILVTSVVFGSAFYIEQIHFNQKPLGFVQAVGKTLRLKLCRSCGNKKTSGVGGDFPVKERTINGIRWGSDCLDCKRSKQAALRAEKKRRLAVKPEPVIKKKQNVSTAFNKSPITVSDVSIGQHDFRLWEVLYDKPLTDVERVEIQTNLMAFVSVLASARHDELGGYVELSENK